MTRLDTTIERLTEWFEKFEQPVVMSSFGKDSMVMLFIIHRIMGKRLPVIYHGVPWRPWKNEWAQSIIKLWNLEVYDYLPLASGIKVKPDLIEIVHRYQMGPEPHQAIDIPVNILPPNGKVQVGPSDRSYECGLNMLARPKGGVLYQWNLTLIGHKDCDIDQFDGHIPLKSDLVEIEGMSALGFPIKDWSDEEVWDFIEERRVPVQYGTRYMDRKEIDYKDLNNDYIEACCACIDPRNPEKVHCPLVNREIDNVSDEVTRFVGRASYIGGGV